MTTESENAQFCFDCVFKYLSRAYCYFINSALTLHKEIYFYRGIGFFGLAIDAIQPISIHAAKMLESWLDSIIEKNSIDHVPFNEIFTYLSILKTAVLLQQNIESLPPPPKEVIPPINPY